MHKYSIGDRIVVDYPSFKVCEGLATIRGYDGSGYAVEFDEFFKGRGHDCFIGIKDKRGLFINDSNIISLEKKTVKFSVGDRVMIRYWDDMEAEFGLNALGEIKCLYCFAKGMKTLCGRQATIKEISGDNITLTDWSNKTDTLYWMYSTSMVCLVKKAESKKKLTVAEIEKTLGYGVEVVKE